jgi:radical SAM enzyme (TIGR01210 family)
MRELYPAAATARDRFVVERRGTRAAHDPWGHQGVIVEDERAEDGSIARVATVFLTGRECPWRCVMCDLWRYTIEEDTPVGAIPGQIAAARKQAEADGGSGRISAINAMKLYNAGSFFDPRAVPESDYDDIAAQLGGLERVIVESHPALIGVRVDRFLDELARQCSRAGRAEVAGSEVLPPRLEVAMGLETAHPVALERLHKRVTLERFAEAAEELRRRDVALRVFVLISPPFIPSDEQDMWLLRSIDFAFECGASVVSLIPTRPGNGAIEALRDERQFRMPTLEDIERSFAGALARVRHARRGRRRVFVDLWDLQRFADGGVDESDLAARRERLRLMNVEQRILPELERIERIERMERNGRAPVEIAGARGDAAS